MRDERRRLIVFRISGLRTSFSVPLICDFLSFFVAHFAGRQSATAAVETRTSARRTAARTAASISRADVTSTLWTPAGVFSATGPAMSVTSCPRLAASAAIANPILPVDGFDRNLTGSRYSLVGPAVMTIFNLTLDYRPDLRGLRAAK